VPTKSLGNFRLGNIFVVGNLLVTAHVHTNSGVKGISTIDIGVPENLVLLDFLGEHSTLYSGFSNGGTFYSATIDG